MNSMEYWDYTVELECIGQAAGTLPPSLTAEYFVQNESSVRSSEQFCATLHGSDY